MELLGSLALQAQDLQVLGVDCAALQAELDVDCWLRREVSRPAALRAVRIARSAATKIQLLEITHRAVEFELRLERQDVRLDRYLGRERAVQRVRDAPLDFAWQAPPRRLRRAHQK